MLGAAYLFTQRSIYPLNTVNNRVFQCSILPPAAAGRSGECEDPLDCIPQMRGLALRHRARRPVQFFFSRALESPAVNKYRRCHLWRDYGSIHLSDCLSGSGLVHFQEVVSSQGADLISLSLLVLSFPISYNQCQSRLNHIFDYLQ